MWTYVQTSGKLIAPDGEVVSTGYSGAGSGKNNPTEENVQNVGPIPEGFYGIDAPINSSKHGPFALPLLPDPGNDMFGRDEFLIHGDSIENPGTASEGCIIQPRVAREQVWESGDHRLQVVKELTSSSS
jgi:type VI secretion system (T6SS) effector TldE1-like protein